MKFLFLILLLCISSYSFSQNWELINQTREYHYIQDHSDLISTTIKVDSSKRFINDSTFYLNRIVVDCTNCNPNKQLAYYNQPQFLQLAVQKTDSSYFFKSPEHFIVRHKAKLNETWLFDTINNIQAAISSIKQVNLFNVTDSIKTIVLSTNDTILISKKYGLIRFDPIYEKYTYKLAGIQNLIGENLPGFYDFSNFSIGDIFEYHGSNWDPGEDPNSDYIEKATIIDKRIIKDTIEYDVDILRLRYARVNPGAYKYHPNSPRDNYKTKWVFTNIPNQPYNGYNNQLLKITDYMNNECEEYYKFSKVIVSKDTNDKYYKTIGSYALSVKSNFYTLIDSINNILETSIDILCDEYEITYKESTGIYSHYNTGFEWNYFKKLVAYKIGNDTIGKLTPDHIMLSINEYDNPITTIYPNPAKNNINVNSNMPIKSISITDLNGKKLLSVSGLITISIKELNDGIYIAGIKFENKTIYRKILKVSK